MTTPEMGRGVLRPALAATRFELLREEPGEAVAPYVEYYWIVRWDLRGQPPHEQAVLSHPNVHLVFEEPETAVYGVQRGVFTRVLRGCGQVLGVRFRPGGFRPLLTSSVSDLTDRSVPAAGLFGPAVTTAERTILGASDVSVMTDTAESLLLSLLPGPGTAVDPVAAEVAAMVERITASPSLFRVDQLADDLGISVRRLQRLFAEHVGAGPKWVLRRARLHEAAARADQGVGIDWAALAADLGYSDQAHLTRDFTATVGASPARYAGE
ncbi:helix-turn-helix domain-containing protein [Streptomyces sp. SPB162]|uniref:AraC family transcriptional regulator n=1 Tax=Streptomyces sp. SPB162 TaxID=2940560 RepID=UPI0024051A14|nr:helix-turn-helix domain-containing protein [Streptomyces sp. SPB162]MDF9812279.1 AraC-like DNA-binding protein [Streptomyces sp. SPB162]